MKENQPNLEINQHAEAALRESAKWCTFLAIMGFIGIGFMLVAAIFMGSIMSSLPDDSSSPFGMMKGFISVFYVILAALYFPPVYYLFKYASDMKAGLYSRNSESISSALISLKTHHKYLGISILVIMGLYVIGIFAMVVFFASSIGKM